MSNPHPLLGRLCLTVDAKTGKEVCGQVVGQNGTKLSFKPGNSDKPFWVEAGKVKPEWVDHIKEQLKRL